jgi:hypothetical protein
MLGLVLLANYLAQVQVRVPATSPFTAWPAPSMRAAPATSVLAAFPVGASFIPPHPVGHIDREL